MNTIFTGIIISDEKDIKLAVKAKEIRIWDRWEHRRDPLIFDDVYVLETGHNLHIIRTRPDGGCAITSFRSKKLMRHEFVDPVRVRMACGDEGVIFYGTIEFI